MDLPLAFMIEDRCMKYNGYEFNSAVNGQCRKYKESDESVEKRGGEDESQLNTNPDGKYTFYTYRDSYRGSRRIVCTSRQLVDLHNDDIREYTWDCRYTDTDQFASVNMDISCGCFQEETLSGGKIAGIVIGATVALAVVAAICFRRICRKKSKKSKKIITSLPVVEPVLVPEIVVAHEV